MARMTNAQLLERIEALEAEVEALKEAHVPSPVQLVYELKPPQPVSAPIDFTTITTDVTWLHSHYDESTGWKFHGYL